jgi:hypothetical protein
VDFPLLTPDGEEDEDKLEVDGVRLGSGEVSGDVDRRGVDFLWLLPNGEEDEKEVEEPGC